jgi:hypothetical protein
LSKDAAPPIQCFDKLMHDDGNNDGPLCHPELVEGRISMRHDARTR